jgi:fucose permease
LGLPDSLIGSAWPVMHLELGVPISYAGVITVIISLGTILSSLMSYKLTKKFGANLVTAASVLMTAVALWGYSISSKFWMLCLFAVPFGLGAGGVDAALNNYVALRYKARHMSWLHCFWGVGASISPYIMGYSLTTGMGWPGGFRIVSVIQLIITAALFITLPLWKNDKSQEESKKPIRLKELLKIKGLPFMLVACFCYCAAESTAMLWSSSYLVKFRKMGEETAAMLASLVFLSLTFGRFVSGFVSEKSSDKNMVRGGVITMLLGICMIAIPDRYNICSMAGLVITGLGCAPVYPSLLHSTPQNFGKEYSQAVIGMQMASTYAAFTFMPPLFGLLAQFNLIGFFPLYLVFFAILLLIMSERLNKIASLK